MVNKNNKIYYIHSIDNNGLYLQYMVLTIVSGIKSRTINLYVNYRTKKGEVFSPISKTYILGKQSVVSWAENGINPKLEAGKWVMSGFNNTRNYLLSGIFTKSPKNNAIEGVVNGNNVTDPIGLGSEKWEVIKGLFGQRMLK